MKRKWFRGILSLLLTLLGAGTAAAQTATTGQISGLITDPTGAVVVGAQVSLTSEAGLVRQAQSDESGRYVFPLLPPGRYKVTVRVQGFNEYSVEGVVVRITEITDLNIQLQLEAQRQAVTVTAEAPLLQTENPTRGTVIQNEVLRQLPLPTRNFQQLLTLTAGTVGSLPNSSELGRGDTVFNVNGQRSISNAVVVNGVDANSIGTGGTPNLAVPATDSIQEFIVQTSTYDASVGRNVGGIVAAVTRSGTNDWHGNLYHFLRNDVLNANNFFLNRAGVKRPVYRRNQFGGTLGGPLKRDKAWIFISYQGTRETNGTSLTNSIATVFVPQNLTNDRSTATLNALAAAWGVPAPHPSAIALLQAVLPDGSFAIPSAPSPNTSCTALGSAPFTTCVGVPVPVSGLSKFREDQFNANLDYQFTTGNRLALKMFWSNTPTTQALYNSFGVGNPLPLPGFGADVDFKQRVVSAIDTHVFSPNLINEARFGYSVIPTRSIPQEPFTSAQIGIASPRSAEFPGMPTISVSNFFDIGASPFSDNDARVQTYTVGDTMTWRKGRHTLKIGGEFKRHLVDLRFALYARGQMFHLGLTGNPFRDFLGAFFNLNGLSIMGSGVNNRNNRAWDLSGFVNDDWRVSDQLTLNLGVRYDFYSPFTERTGRYIGFDPALAQTVVIPPLPPFTTSPGVAITGGFVQAGNAENPLPGIPTTRDSLVPPDKNNIGPRVGFAWQPRAMSSRLVVRGGYGFYFDRPNARLFNNQVLNFPYYTLAQVFTAPISSPFVQVPAPSAFPLPFNNATLYPYGGPPAVLPAAVAASSCAPAGQTCIGANGLYPDISNFRTPYVQQYNLGIQYEIIKDWLLDVGYVGSRGRKLLRLVALNQGLAAGGPGPLSPGLSSLAAPAFGVHMMQSSSSSSYNSIQATVTKRYSYGLQFLLAYTYSHSLDDFSGDASGTSDNAVVPGDARPGLQRNYASSDFDRRHRVVFSFIYDFPKFYKGDAGFAKLMANDWQIAGILTAQAGTPFSVLTNATAFVQARADFAPGCTAETATLRGSVHSRLDLYFDPACFVAASGVGNFGNTGRNILRGPDQRNIDLSIIKFFPVSETNRFEFRAEFFNFTNTPSFANPINLPARTSLTAPINPNLGRIIRTSTGPRVIQFALKYNF